MQEKRTQIKICGLTSEEEVRWVLEENVDYFGIVLFFPKSKRNISIEKAKQLIAVCREIHSRSDHDVVKSEVLKQRPRVVAVTVSPTPEQVQEIEQAGFDRIQIHGELSKEAYAAVTIPIIRAIQIKDGIFNMEPPFTEQGMDDKITAYLFDAPSPGSGQTFDWDMLARLSKTDKMLFLAGGLNSDNVREAIAKVKPDVVDVSSGVEIGVMTVGKDRNKIKQFVRKVDTNE
ncbi:MAG: phosphoribosylanthranilate isomerase [Lachnospiraceae bacterium]|nr:phosphoribosylanthranilate isomerase [Lachnospiraceae bacterium]